VGRSRVAARDYCAIGQKYAEQVVSGEIPACEWVRLACQRQIDDQLKKDWQWKFDPGKANRVCAFLEKLPHVKGRWKSPNLLLEAWQCFFITTIFGWVDQAGLRRFRKALIVVPRKNAKTTICAGIALFLLCADREPGAEVYSAAVTRDQAKISWEIAQRMVKREPEMQDYFGVQALAHSIVTDDGSSFKPLSRDADSLEGLSPHGAVVDELHAHKTREVFDVLDEATGARSQPLIFIISTEGDNPTGVFPEQVAYGQQVLRGSHEDEAYFAVIYGIDKEDDWTLPESWRKANPNYGVSIFERDLETRFKQALKNPASQSSFKTKRLNIRVGAGDAYFNVLAWDTICKDSSLKLEDFYGQPCKMMLDLASKRDLTAKIYLFRHGSGYAVFGRYYLPEAALIAGSVNYDFYRGWSERGFITFTEGNRTDYAVVESDILEEDLKHFQPEMIGVDPNYNAEHLTQRLTSGGAPMQEVPHTVVNFSEAMKTLEAMIVGGQIHHNGDPVLAWAIGNVLAKKDVKQNVYPRKGRDENKIDPAVCLIGVMSLELRDALDASAYASLDASKIAV
jgi:phage terminase large subunit-like protein